MFFCVPDAVTSVLVQTGMEEVFSPGAKTRKVSGWFWLAQGSLEHPLLALAVIARPRARTIHPKLRVGITLLTIVAE
jgi:hypothetical protein